MTTTGMSRTTGAPLSDEDHIQQSVSDILSTPLGTRVMRRDYGSLLFDLSDMPMNPAVRLLCIMASAMAIARWEPRITVQKIQWAGDFASGNATLTMTGQIATTTATANSLTRLTIPLA